MRKIPNSILHPHSKFFNPCPPRPLQFLRRHPRQQRLHRRRLPRTSRSAAQIPTCSSPKPTVQASCEYFVLQTIPVACCICSHPAHAFELQIRSDAAGRCSAETLEMKMTEISKVIRAKWRAVSALHPPSPAKAIEIPLVALIFSCFLDGAQSPSLFLSDGAQSLSLFLSDGASPRSSAPRRRPSGLKRRRRSKAQRPPARARAARRRPLARGQSRRTCCGPRRSARRCSRSSRTSRRAPSRSLPPHPHLPSP